MTTPRVSVIIPNHNYAQFLGEAIESVLAQEYENKEVIVVDDGSTDASTSVIRQYEGRIRAIFKDNGGQASAFNAGFERSTGDWILVLDADDVLLVNALSRLGPATAEHGVAKVHWPLLVIDGEGRSLASRYPQAALPQGDLSRASIEQGPLHDVHSPMSGNLWRRSFLEVISPVPELGDRHGLDGYLLTLAPIYGRVARIDEPLSCYRLHRSNFSRGTLRVRLSRLRSRFEARARLLQEHLSSLEVSAEPDTWKARNYRYRWLGRMLALPEALATVVPAGEPLAVVDDEQSAVEMLDSWDARPFPESEGLYIGPPADATAALSALRHTVDKGVRFLTITEPSLWWLDFYPAFANELLSHHRCLLETDTLLVFALDAGAEVGRGSRHTQEQAGESSKAIRRELS